MRIRTPVSPALTAAGGAVAWTALALAVPVITTRPTTALVTIGAVAAVAVVTTRRRVPLVLAAAAGCALLIFLVTGLLLPAVPGFVVHDDPPVYTPGLTRMADPVAELTVFVLLMAALGATAGRSRWIARRRSRPIPVAGPTEMVVEPGPSGP